MKETLIKNGHPKHLIKRGIREGEAIVKRMINKSQNQQQNPANVKNIFFTLTYYGKESDMLAQRITSICRKYFTLNET